jgi:hypothetical protein
MDTVMNPNTNDVDLSPPHTCSRKCNQSKCFTRVHECSSSFLLTKFSFSEKKKCIIRPCVEIWDRGIGHSRRKDPRSRARSPRCNGTVSFDARPHKKAEKKENKKQHVPFFRRRRTTVLTAAITTTTETDTAIAMIVHLN